MTTRPCPSCGVEMPTATGYPDWCSACEWNLLPPTRPGAEGRLGRGLARAAARLDERTFRRITAADADAPGLSWARVAAMTIALLTHAFTIALLVCGVWIIAALFPNPFAFLPGLLLIGLAIVMRPRLGRVPEEGRVARDEAPELHRLVDEVSTTLGTRPPHVIVLDQSLNASWAVLGPRRRRVLTLGLPMLLCLEPQEQVALVAHELAHARHGDASRGLVIGSAVGALASLVGSLSPGGGRHDGISDVLAAGAMWVVARPFVLLLHLEWGLLLRDAQRSEYLADAAAAEVAGTEAAIALHEKLLLSPIVDAVGTRAVTLIRGGERGDDILAAMARAVRAAPERELERRRRVAAHEGARLEDTHPPTARRIQLLRERTACPSLVVVPPDRAAAIAAEVGRHTTRIARLLADDYRARLYG